MGRMADGGRAVKELPTRCAVGLTRNSHRMVGLTAASQKIGIRKYSDRRYLGGFVRRARLYGRSACQVS